MSNDKVRAEFEAWANSFFANAPTNYKRDALPKDDPNHGDYASKPLQVAWLAWQASRAAHDVQGEPVVVPFAWVAVSPCGEMSEMQSTEQCARDLADDWNKELHTLHPGPACHVQPLYTAPQPATEAALLEAFVAETAAKAEAAELAGALDEMIKAADVASWGGYFPTDAVTRAVDALAAYRQQGGDA